MSAKNSLSNNNGYSPNQLIYGKTFNFSSVLTNNLPALNEEISSKTVSDNLQTLHAARKTFTAADNLNRIKKSLKTMFKSTMNFDMTMVIKYIINRKVVVSGTALLL